jgi:hypothetical protein
VILSAKPSSELRYLRFVSLICIGALLVLTFRQYTFAYFWIDDFTSLYWVQPQTFTQMLGHVLNPASDFFRPVGMSFYWIALQLFDRNAFAFHVLLWSLHTLNVGLIYWTLRRFTGSEAGAAVGAMLFSSQYVFNDLYWSFGTIFEVVGLMLYLVGLLVWSRERRTITDAIVASIVFLFALKAKEMAITLPAIWLAYDLLVRPDFRWRMLTHFTMPSAAGAWYGLRKVVEMRSPLPDQPYYIDLSSLTLGRGFGAYFNTLFTTQWRWQIWAIGFGILLLWFSLFKKRLAAFFLLYVFITFLPVIFLVNHREFFYWYFPIVGVCGLAALLVSYVTTVSLRLIPKRMVVPLASALFILLSQRAYVRMRDLTEARRMWQQGIAQEYREFVTHVRSRPTPKPGETLVFKSYPRYFDKVILRCATQVALRRSDVDIEVVE